MNFSKKEISYDKFAMQECNGNLKKISYLWELNKNKFDTSSTSSIGYMATNIFETFSIINDITYNLSELLNSSIKYFESVGVHFEDVDNETAEELKE